MWPLEYLIKKPLVTTKRTTINLFKIKSCNELQRILLICIYLKTGVTYRFLILNAYTDHTDTQHLLEQGCEDPWLFFEAGRDLQTKIFRKHCPIHFRFSINSYKAHVLLFNSRQERFYFYFFFNFFFFILKKHPDRHWGLASLLFNGYRGLCCPGRIATGTWSWPHTFI